MKNKNVKNSEIKKANCNYYCSSKHPRNIKPKQQRMDISVKLFCDMRAAEAIENEYVDFPNIDCFTEFSEATSKFASSLFSEMNSTSVDHMVSWSTFESQLFHHEVALFFSRVFQAANFATKGIFNVKNNNNKF